MSEHFNQLTPAEAERLAYLIEEMAEAQHMACKVLRHGYKSHDPTASKPLTNRQMLGDELSDVMTAIGLIARTDVVCAERSEPSRYLHHQGQ